ncbi:hypothetical protein [Campylobacter devanensis]|uniref:hypothetical protein n=1 Tax=Campylobacter devanensis TaxID=3161138 RepID=UPI0015D735B1|nr:MULTISPECIES: hypothetical protein [unclassified Campylobacter]
MISRLNLFWLFIALALNSALLIFSMSGLSISYYEAQIYYSNSNLGFILRYISSIFGDNEIVIRGLFLTLHIANSLLIYIISLRILKRQSDCVIAAILYMFLPGVLVSALIINQASIAIFITLIVVFLQQRQMYILMSLILALSLFFSKPFIALYLAIMLFGLFSRDKKFAIIGAFFCIVWYYLNGLESSGKPRGYFLDSIAVFAAVFSPLLFIYFIYTIYRICIKEIKSFLWFISLTALGVCLLLSMRQRVELELFLPFCVILVPAMVRTFFSSYRSRLPRFRVLYKLICIIVLVTLALNSLAIIFHQYLYIFLDNPKNHFAYKYDIAKELAKALKDRQITAISTNPNLALRLKFYGIPMGGNYYLDTTYKKSCEQIKIYKFNKSIAKFYLCKK